MENNKYTATPDWFKPSASEQQMQTSTTTTQNITNQYTVIGGNSGIKPEQFWELLTADTSEQINKSHINDAFSQLSEEAGFLISADLADYSTKEWVNSQNYINNSDLTNKLNSYVTIDTEQEISAKKHFLNGLTVGNNKKHVYEQDGILYIDSDLAITGGIVVHALGNRGISTIMDGIVCDNTTIKIDEYGKLSVIGDLSGGIDNISISGSGNAITSVSLSHNGKSISFTKDQVFATNDDLNTKFNQVYNKLNDFLEGSDSDNIINKWKELEAFLSGMEETDNLSEILSIKVDRTELNNYVNLTKEQNITGIKHFINGLSVGNSKHKLYESNGVVYLEGDLAITGGITTYASNNISVSTIMDGVTVDGITITKVNGMLKVLNAGGGEAGSVEWANVKNKPTTLSGYGITDGVNSVTVNGTGNAITSASISGHTLTLTKRSTFLLSSQYTASDILTKLKTVDGANSGLDADTLDGIHANGLFTALSSNTTTNLSITIGGTTKSIADLAANTAAKLQTPRTLWGKSFDGTSNLTGDISINGNVLAAKCITRGGNLNDSWSDGTNTHPWYGIDSRYYNTGIYSTTITDYHGMLLKTGSGILSITSGGNVGIGTTSPSQKLHVSGNTYITGNLTIGVSSSTYKLDVKGHAKIRSALLLGTSDSTIFSANDKPIFKWEGSMYNTLYLCSTGSSIYFRPKGYSSSTGQMVLDNTGQLTVNGNILSTGGITCYSSDERAKTVIEKVDISLKDIANAPTIRFKWNDWKIKDDNKTHIGGIAQYMQKLLPETVLESDGMLNLDYATTGYIFAVQTAKYLTKTNTEVNRLKKQIKKLEERIKQLEYEKINIMVN